MSALVGGPQVNKFEQVSSLGHQMSLLGELGQGPLQVGSMSRDGAKAGGRSLVRFSASRLMVT